MTIDPSSNPLNGQEAEKLFIELNEHKEEHIDLAPPSTRYA